MCHFFQNTENNDVQMQIHLVACEKIAATEENWLNQNCYYAYPAQSGSCFNIWYLFIKSRKVSMPRGLYRFAILQAPRRHIGSGVTSSPFLRYACQILQRHKHFDTRSCAFESLRDLTMTLLIVYWNRAWSTNSLGFWWKPYVTECLIQTEYTKYTFL